MGIFSAIFGGGTTGASEQSAEATRADNAARLAFIEKQSGQAREDVLGLFPSALDVQAQGTQGALDVISGGIPAQLDARNQGNFLAQQQVANIPQQFQNAILGDPIQQFQPQQAPSVDLSFLQGLQAPQVQQPSVQQFQQQPQAQPPQNPLQQLFAQQGIGGALGGRFAGGLF